MRIRTCTHLFAVIDNKTFHSGRGGRYTPPHSGMKQENKKKTWDKPYIYYISFCKIKKGHVLFFWYSANIHHYKNYTCATVARASDFGETSGEEKIYLNTRRAGPHSAPSNTEKNKFTHFKHSLKCAQLQKTVRTKRSFCLSAFSCLTTAQSIREMQKLFNSA